MAIVNERMNPKPVTQVDPKTGKAISTTPARTASPGVPDSGDGNSGFFGSFFAGKNKKKAAAMEPPPPMLKASGNLSEREAMEVEVISTSKRAHADWVPYYLKNLLTETATSELLIASYFNIVKRTMIDMVPKAIMLNLVQYVTPVYAILSWHLAHVDWYFDLQVHERKHARGTPCKHVQERAIG